MSLHLIANPARRDSGRLATRERLRAAIRYYERHVISWYALGRVDEARRARDAIRSFRRALAEDTGERRAM